jgi:hypothetical protein
MMGWTGRAALKGRRSDTEEEEDIRTEHDVPDPAVTKAPVSREEIVDHVGAAFAGQAPARDDLVDAAVRSGARPEALAVLRLLPPQRYHRPHDLWEHLPEVPIER